MRLTQRPISKGFLLSPAELHYWRYSSKQCRRSLSVNRGLYIYIFIHHWLALALVKVREVVLRVFSKQWPSVASFWPGTTSIGNGRNTTVEAWHVCGFHGDLMFACVFRHSLTACVCFKRVPSHSGENRFPALGRFVRSWEKKKTKVPRSILLQAILSLNWSYVIIAQNSAHFYFVRKKAVY